MANTKIELALFGVGRIGPTHLNSIARHPRAHLKYLVEFDLALAKKCLDEEGLEDAVIVPANEVAKVYADKSLHGVIVCTPTPTHQKIITESLRAGKAVFTEKPLAHDSAAADECYKVAEECKLPLLCGFNRRFDPTYDSIIKRVGEGAIGHVRYIKTTLRDTMDPSWPMLGTIGTCWVDLLIHDVDLACAVMGELPITVSADGDAFADVIRKNNDFDQAIINLKFPSGALATVEASRFCNYGYDQRLEVFGIGGMLEGANFHDDQSKLYTANGMNRPLLQPSFQQRYRESYYLELDHFIKVIQGKEKLRVTRKDGVAAIKICETAEKANATKSTISLQW
ncbi:inositol 2-dehydrogenase-like [Amphiura filiformis]|uniref:inositol 2-dehydrogenase-like n=1 Tax=Amphiura filiformis TaxID=82378 RepID=UPI003B20C3DD